MNSDMSVYLEQFKIYANEVDMNKRAKITTVLDYLQNTAWAHYNAFEKQNGRILSDNLIWAILKLKLSMTEMPSWEDVIKVKTWAPFVDKYFAYRNFEIMDKKDKIIGTSTFNWVILDLIKKKIVMPQEFINKWQFHETPLFFDIKGKIEKLKEPELKREITVSYSDIDVNNHVNNVKYIQWIVDCIDYKIMKKKVIKEIEANFLSEALINDNLLVNIQKMPSNTLTYLGNIERKQDKKELCRIKILF